nr:MAG TPA: hypothetical protein [Bacteriophage sp.]
MKQEFTFDKLKELTDKAIEPYLVSIEQALGSPLSQNLTREQQAQMVEQMFTRSLRLVNFAFFKEVNNYVDTLTQADVEKEKKAQAKKARQEKIKTTAKKANPNHKMTLKELRERRAKHGEAELRERRAKQLNNNEQKD